MNLCKFVQFIKCDNFWHICDCDISEEFESGSLYCAYCNHCQICGCCGTCGKPECEKEHI